MIPKMNGLLSDNIAVQLLPTRTYAVDTEKGVIVKYCDHLEATKQLIYKILNTQRYQHTIYTWNYGLELADLFGEPISYVYPEIQRRITEALLQDDRIEEVCDFSFHSMKKGDVSVKFKVMTIFGLIQTQTEVNM